MLARHGYGVLLFDRRGEGRSEGEPNAWGWGGDATSRPRSRTCSGGPTSSPAGSAGSASRSAARCCSRRRRETDALDAVVSEGAGARSIREDLDEEMPASDADPRRRRSARSRRPAMAVFAHQPPPPDLQQLAGRMQAPALLIAAPNSGHGEELNRGYAAAAGARAVGDPRVRPRRRAGGPARGVRAARRRLLRRSSALSRPASASLARRYARNGPTSRSRPVTRRSSSPGGNLRPWRWMLSTSHARRGPKSPCSSCASRSGRSARSVSHSCAAIRLPSV